MIRLAEAKPGNTETAISSVSSKIPYIRIRVHTHVPHHMQLTIIIIILSIVGIFNFCGQRPLPSRFSWLTLTLKSSQSTGTTYKTLQFTYVYIYIYVCTYLVCLSRHWDGSPPWYTTIWGRWTQTHTHTLNAITIDTYTTHPKDQTHTHTHSYTHIHTHTHYNNIMAKLHLLRIIEIWNNYHPHTIGPFDLYICTLQSPS